MKDRLFIAILLFLLLFFLNFICTFEFIKIQKIKQKINYVEDISNGIYFLFNENNLNYYEDKLDTYIKNISLAVNINNNTKNVLYYLNQIINNNGNITNLFPIDTSISKKNEIDEFYIKFNKTSLGILNQVYVNQPLDKIKKYINNLVNNGLSEYSPFENINRTDSRQKRYETPMSYFSIINGRLEKTLRKQYSYADFNCNEYWDIYPPSQSPEIYVYLPKSEAITNNHYTNHNKPRILNWVEWDFSEIMERYSILNNIGLDTIYNLLFYEFSGLENLRGDKIKNNFIKVDSINIQLENNQTELIALLKNSSILANEIIYNYKNIFDDYIKENQELYSFLNCDFIKNDLNYLFSEIENSFINKFRKLYDFRSYLFLSLFILEAILIVFYCLSSYDLYETKEIKEDEEDNIIERIRREINWSREIQLEQDALSVDGNRKKNFEENRTHNTFVFRGFEDQKSINNILKLKKNSNATNTFFKNIFGYKQAQQNVQPTLEIVIQRKNGENIAVNQLDAESDQSKVSIISKEKEKEDLMPTKKNLIKSNKKII